MLAASLALGLGLVAGVLSARLQRWRGVAVTLNAAWWVCLAVALPDGITDAEARTLGLTLAAGVVGFSLTATPARLRPRRRTPPRAPKTTTPLAPPPATTTPR
ncbi:hypothetical protein [uncultured Pseudokineococcus sp.]|uniref:hypothetical protein n=1 Tax=uncultured Pseudokineococcus sp. TaxID=1642928 RepID=UPI002630EDD2|nr:hypothetical protein [uncultured Pseudokineococcus sp.]